MSATVPAEFCERHRLWLLSLSDKDRNSLWHQIVRLLNDTLIFRVSCELRDPWLEQVPQGKRLLGLSLRNYDVCFFETQLASIRRLADECRGQKDPLTGPRGVFSLVSVLNDMERHAAHMTRGNLLALEFEDREPTEYRQRTLDMLCGVTAAHRSDEDTIEARWYPALRERVQEATVSISHYVNKFVAHNAIPESRRATKDDEEPRVLVGEVWRAQEVIARVMNTISSTLLGKGYNLFVSTHPPVREDTDSDWPARWKALAEEIGGWPRYTADDLFGSVRPRGAS